MTIELIQALRRPGILGSVGTVELVETHISYVLLTGKFAYKIKKPVNLGFVDFSTLEKRLHFCLEELRLNRRLAEDLYLRVVRITGTMEHPQMDGSGATLEFAVKMKQFPSAAELRNVIREGGVPTCCFERLAVSLVQFHDHAAAANPDSPFASYEVLRQQAMDNFQDIQSFPIGPKIAQRMSVLMRWTSMSLTRHKTDFLKRKTDLRIRECHGDLHLGNLVLMDDHIVPFDCLEFNEDFRWIDVASELAFLVMDLYAHHHAEYARRILNSYLEASGDYEMISLLRHYLVYRSMVLAKVSCLRSQRVPLGITSNSDLLSYLELAENIVRHPPRKQLIITHGLSGCGKTWVSDRLIERTDLIRIRSDVLRKQLHGLGVTGASDSSLNLGIYTKDATQVVYDSLAETAATILEAGYPVIVDATFLKWAQRRMFQEIAVAQRVPFRILHLDAPKSVLTKRITERYQAKSDASEADMSVLENQIRYAEPLDTTEKHDTLEVSSAMEWSEASVESVLRGLRLENNPRQTTVKM